ncbi:transposase [Wukongibacter sp. M2B1]|uniref:transposase n=1 Tax=Wukongibacter sp. M2B1 TaxID=3088895 RepID=UPI003D792BBB
MSRKKYNKEFKIQVVKQVVEEGKKISHIASELELSRNMVSRWINEYENHGEQAFIVSGNLRHDHEFKIKTLKKQVETLMQERNI